MKKFDEEKLRNAYPEAPESFHNRVTETLDSLDIIKPVHTGKSKRKKLIALCAAAAILGTFTVTAAATHFFGFVVTRNGNYGLNVKLEDSEAPADRIQNMNMVFGYMPDKYKNSCDSKSWFDYQNGDEYFSAWVQRSENYEYDFLNVIENSEASYDGHKTLFLTFKEAENSDRLYYASLKYFDDYNCLVHCNCSDKEELIKITEKVNVEPAPDDQKPADLRDDDEAEPETWAIKEYEEMYYGIMMVNEYFAGNIKQVKTGETMEFSLADYDQDAVKLKAKVNFFEKRENADGLDKKDFTDIGANYVYNLFFDTNGNLIKEKTEKNYDDGDENNLGTITEVTYVRNFYVADMEITAEGDIEDLNKIFDAEIYGLDGNNFINDAVYPSGARAMCIYRTKLNEGFSIKKGETVNIKVGFIAEDETEDTSYLMLSGIDEPEDNFQNYMLKVKE